MAMWLGSVVLLFPTYFTSMFISSIVMRLFDEVVMNSYKKALVLLFYPFFFFSVGCEPMFKKKNCCHFTMFHCIYLQAHLLKSRTLYRCFYMPCYMFFFFLLYTKMLVTKGDFEDNKKMSLQSGIIISYVVGGFLRYSTMSMSGLPKSTLSFVRPK